MLDTILQVETPEGVDLDLAVAGPVPRFLAWLIDLFIRFIIVFNLAIAVAFLGNLGSGLLLLVLFLTEWFYPVLFEVFGKGATPGKRFLRLRVLHLDGTPVDWGASVLRNLMRAADFLPLFYCIGLICMLTNRRFQRLGDLASGTIVVYRERGFRQYETTMPVCTPHQPEVPLRLEEQRAIILFAQRISNLSTTRARELADIAVTSLSGLRDPTVLNPVEWLCGIANWLRRGEPNSRSGEGG